MIIDFSGGKKGEKCCRLSNSIWNLNARFALVYFDFFFFSFFFLFHSQKCFLELKKKINKMCTQKKRIIFSFPFSHSSLPRRRKIYPKGIWVWKRNENSRTFSLPPSSVFPMPQQSYPFERLKFLSRWGDAAESRGRGSNSSKIWNESVSLTEWDLNVFRAWKSE